MEKVRYMISDAAGLVNVEAHVLRYWEEELELDIPRNELGHRYYTKENIEQFLKIKEWKEKGYQLKAIKMLVHEKSTEPEVETETRELLSANRYIRKWWMCIPARWDMQSRTDGARRR